MNRHDEMVREARGLYVSLYASRTATRKQLKRARRVIRRAGDIKAKEAYR